MHISKTLIKKNHAVSNYQKAINILLKAKFAFGLKQHVQIRYHIELPIQSRQYRQNYRCVCSWVFLKKCCIMQFVHRILKLFYMHDLIYCTTKMC